MANELRILATLAKDEKKLQEIGSEIVREAIKCVIEEKMGIEMSDPDVSIEINRGDIVPVDLACGEAIQIDSEGRSKDCWKRGWKRVNRIWKRGWKRICPCDWKINPDLNEITAEMLLTQDEFKIAKEMGLLSDKI